MKKENLKQLFILKWKKGVITILLLSLNIILCTNISWGAIIKENIQSNCGNSDDRTGNINPYNPRKNTYYYKYGPVTFSVPKKVGIPPQEDCKIFKNRSYVGTLKLVRKQQVAYWSQYPFQVDKVGDYTFDQNSNLHVYIDHRPPKVSALRSSIEDDALYCEYNVSDETNRIWSILYKHY